jgi:hypothetical protein
MIYELRVYEAVEGKAAAMRQRFQMEAAPRLKKYGVEILGIFVGPQEDGKLTYISRFPNDEARQAAWAAFGSDPEWQAVKARTEVDGPLLLKQTITVLKPVAAELLLG